MEKVWKWRVWFVLSFSLFLSLSGAVRVLSLSLSPLLVSPTPSFLSLCMYRDGETGQNRQTEAERHTDKHGHEDKVNLGAKKTDRPKRKKKKKKKRRRPTNRRRANKQTCKQKGTQTGRQTRRQKNREHQPERTDGGSQKHKEEAMREERHGVSVSYCCFLSLNRLRVLRQLHTQKSTTYRMNR